MATINTQISLTDGMSASLKTITGSLDKMNSSFTNLETNMNKGLPSPATEIKTGMDEATKSTDNLADKQEEVNDKIQEGANLASGLAGKLAGVVAAIGFGNMAKEAIEYASDLGEVENVTNTVFGAANSAKVTEWAKNCLDAYGINELSAKKYLGTMGAMIEAAGISGEELMDMSMAMTTLSGDMASFYNLDPEEAFNKLRSGISGETEPLKSLGINMSVANLQAYALSKGIETEYAKMSQAEQVQLRYNFLMEKTAKVQGDFTKTCSSFSNQQKLLSENWKAMTGELATNFIPILEQLFAGLNAGIKFLQQNLDIILPIFLAILGVVAAYAAVNMALGAATAFAAIKQWTLNSAVLACPIFWIIAALIVLIATLYIVIDKINETKGTTISATGIIAGAVYSLFAYLWNIVAAFVNFFANVWSDPLGSIARLFGDLANNVLGFLELIARGIDAVFGSNLASTVNGWKTGLDNAIKNKFGEGITVMERKDVSEAFDIGYAWGAAKEQQIGEALENIDSIAESSASAAQSAGSAAKSLETSLEDLKYIRDIAEREIINRFTTAEVKVDFGGVTNNVSSGMDLDGVIDYIASGVSEALEITAEGVHA